MSDLSEWHVIAFRGEEILYWSASGFTSREESAGLTHADAKVKRDRIKAAFPDLRVAIMGLE